MLIEDGRFGEHEDGDGRQPHRRRQRIISASVRRQRDDRLADATTSASSPSTRRPVTTRRRPTRASSARRRRTTTPSATSPRASRRALQRAPTRPRTTMGRPLLRCDAEPPASRPLRAALAAYLASNPQPTFRLEGARPTRRALPFDNARVTPRLPVGRDVHGRRRPLSLRRASDERRLHGRRLEQALNLHDAAADRHHPAGARTVDFPATAKLIRSAAASRRRGARIAGATVSSRARFATATTDTNGYYTFSGCRRAASTPSRLRARATSFTPPPKRPKTWADEFIAFTPRRSSTPSSGSLACPAARSAASASARRGRRHRHGLDQLAGRLHVRRRAARRQLHGHARPNRRLHFQPASRASKPRRRPGRPYTARRRATTDGARHLRRRGAFGRRGHVTGSQAATATTDSNGNYSLTLPATATHGPPFEEELLVRARAGDRQPARRPLGRLHGDAQSAQDFGPRRAL